MLTISKPASRRGGPKVPGPKSIAKESNIWSRQVACILGGERKLIRRRRTERWAAAYAGQSKAVPDADLDAALNAEPAARKLFDALDSANHFAILYRVQQAKTPEKRAVKIAEMVSMLSRGDTIHPLRAKRSS